jgi:hypothetical protein
MPAYRIGTPLLLDISVRVEKFQQSPADSRDLGV